jgi:hypothetical protein
VACVHQVSYVDFWRAPQTQAGVPTGVPELVQLESSRLDPVS